MAQDVIHTTLLLPYARTKREARAIVAGLVAEGATYNFRPDYVIVGLVALRWESSRGLPLRRPCPDRILVATIKYAKPS